MNANFHFTALNVIDRTFIRNVKGNVHMSCTVTYLASQYAAKKVIFNLNK